MNWFISFSVMLAKCRIHDLIVVAESTGVQTQHKNESWCDKLTNPFSSLLVTWWRFGICPLYDGALWHCHWCHKPPPQRLTALCVWSWSSFMMPWLNTGTKHKKRYKLHLLRSRLVTLGFKWDTNSHVWDPQLEPQPLHQYLYIPGTLESCASIPEWPSASPPRVTRKRSDWTLN